MSSLRTALEEAIAANFDDLAAHSAYADYLQEQGDPRGELIQVQLALEAARPAEERQRLQHREKELLDAYLPEWLGEIAYVLSEEEIRGESAVDTYHLEYYGRKTNSFRFMRGWLESLDLRQINASFARDLARCPTIRMLRRLIVRGADFEEVEAGQCYDAFAELPALDSIRFFTLGREGAACHLNGEGVAPLIARMPRLEELSLHAHEVEVGEVFALSLPNLRTLHVYHLREYPLEVLATNSTLTNLVALDCYPHALLPGNDRAYIQPENFLPLVNSPHLKSLAHLKINQSDIGDEGARAIVESGILKQLRVLNLDNGCISDAGAKLLADCPQVRRLEQLSIRGNVLTDRGVAWLRATGVPLAADCQFDADEVSEDLEYLWEGDME